MLSIKSWVVIKLYPNKTLKFDLNLKLLFSKINSILKPSRKFNCTIIMLITDNWQKDHENTVAIFKSWILTKESHHQLLVTFVFSPLFCGHRAADYRSTPICKLAEFRLKLWSNLSAIIIACWVRWIRTLKLILQASTVYYLWIFIFAYFLKWDNIEHS